MMDKLSSIFWHKKQFVYAMGIGRGTIVFILFYFVGIG
jgi:hypothetical protein